MIGLIVDGYCEKEAFPAQMQSKCVVRRRQSNGNCVSLLQIANECANLLRALEGRRCRKLLIVVDREDRPITAQEMADQLIVMISAKVSVAFKLVVADRMFENWLLADIEAVAGKYANDFSAVANTPTNEGSNGKTRFKQLMKKPYSYCPGVAKKYYSSIRIPVAERNSLSFRSWIAALNALSILHR